MSKRLMLIIAIVLVATVVFARNIETGYEPDGLDELVKRDGSFKTTLVHPDADFARYAKLYQRKVMLVVRDPSSESGQTTGSLIGGRGRNSVMPEWEELADLKKIVSEALEAEISAQTELEPAHVAGPGTLVLRPVVTDVVFTTSSKNKSEDGRELPCLSSGTIVFDLVDGETGIIQARFAERRKCRPPKGSEAPTGAWPNVDHWAGSAAADLCEELARLGAG